MIKREIIEDFVDYFSTFILLVAVTTIDATFVWVTFKFLIEYPITWMAAYGGCALLRYVKSEIKSTI
jgi:hypothetical protein